VLSERPCKSNQFYIYNRWGCNTGDSRCNYHLSWQGLNGVLLPPSDTYDLVPWAVTVIDADTTDADLAYKFAPRMMFDTVGEGYNPNYPMSAQAFYDQAVAVTQTSRVKNTSYSSISSNSVPTYYQVVRCQGQVRIMYWQFYGYRATDSCVSETNGDWTRIMVTVSEDQSQVAAVTYYARAANFTRLTARDGVELTLSTSPVVYVGRTAHGNYHKPEGDGGSCGIWDDPHNNDGSAGAPHMDTWHNLVSIDDSMEPWMIKERAAPFYWGTWKGNGTDRHPTQMGPTCQMDAYYKGNAIDTDSDRYTQCREGDIQTDFGDANCTIPCADGYTNYDGWCKDGIHSYTQKTYSYDYYIPISDQGLL
jgi:hypothetical protein